MIAALTAQIYEGQVGTWTTPAGWTKLAESPNAAPTRIPGSNNEFDVSGVGRQRAAFFARQYVSGSSQTFTRTGGSEASGGIMLCYRGMPSLQNLRFGPVAYEWGVTRTPSGFTINDVVARSTESGRGVPVIGFVLTSTGAARHADPTTPPSEERVSAPLHTSGSALGGRAYEFQGQQARESGPLVVPMTGGYLTSFVSLAVSLGTGSGNPIRMAA